MTPLEDFGAKILENEDTVRLGSFAALFAIFALVEAIYPRRKKVGSMPIRWYSNITLSFFNIYLLRFIFPVLGLGMAATCTKYGWGFFNGFADEISMPYWLKFVLALLALDFIVYLHHIMFHAVPWLWRLHRVHHADVDLDVSSGIRFHFLESIISMVIKLGAIVLIGPPVLAVLAFEIVLNGAAMFNHANMRLPLPVDRVVRLFLVTPDMHRVHHSVIPRETNSNYGFNVPWWDWLFGTYIAQPQEGHDGMTVGLDRFRSDKEQHLHQLLIQPFRGDAGVPCSLSATKEADAIPDPGLPNQA